LPRYSAIMMNFVLRLTIIALIAMPVRDRHAGAALD